MKAKRCCLHRVKAIAALPERERESFLAASILQQTPIGSIEEPVIAEEPPVDPANCQFEVQSKETK